MTIGYFSQLLSYYGYWYIIIKKTKIFMQMFEQAHSAVVGALTRMLLTIAQKQKF